MELSVVDINQGENQYSYHRGNGAGQETHQENTHQRLLPLLFLGEIMKPLFSIPDALIILPPFSIWFIFSFILKKNTFVG